jgi:acetate---CoA ligase (ADP-forming)
VSLQADRILADWAIGKLFKPRSVSIIGASADHNKTAGRPIAYLLKHGFSGAIYRVNPKLQRLGDLPCYPDVDALPEVPDVAIVLVGAKNAIAAVAALSKKGCAAAIVLASGFGESGHDGLALQTQLLQAAGAMRLLGPNTLGLINLNQAIVLCASGALEMDAFVAGSVGLISQSGGVLSAVLSRAMGLSKLVATCNEADLELADFMNHLVDDPATKVIALYIEAIRQPDKFRAAAARAQAAGKPVVAFKVGRSEAGARAAVSHTGAMAGSDRMYDAFFDSTGVIRAPNFSDLLNISSLLSTGRSLQGRRVAILTSTGGAGTLVSDSLGLVGFETLEPDPHTLAALRAVQVNGVSIPAALDSNPIDVTLAGLQSEFLTGLCKVLMNSAQYDALCVIVGASGIANPRLMADAIAAQLAESSKPVLAYISPHAPHVLPVLMGSGVPAYTEAQDCATALQALHQFSKQQNRRQATPAEIPTAPAEQGDAYVDWHGSLNEAQAKQFLARYGVAGTQEVVVPNDAHWQQASAHAVQQVQGPQARVVLKLLSNDITHKSDVGGVCVGVALPDVAQSLSQMAQKVSAHTGQNPSAFLVQEMITGGVSAELINDTTLKMLPTTQGQVQALTLQDAHEMIDNLKTSVLLKGYRGKPLADVDALAQTIIHISSMVAQLGDRLIEAEINPLFVLPQGQGCKAGDGVVVLS